MSIVTQEQKPLITYSREQLMKFNVPVDSKLNQGVIFQLMPHFLDRGNQFPTVVKKNSPTVPQVQDKQQVTPKSTPQEPLKRVSLSVKAQVPPPSRKMENILRVAAMTKSTTTPTSGINNQNNVGNNSSKNRTPGRINNLGKENVENTFPKQNSSKSLPPTPMVPLCSQPTLIIAPPCLQPTTPISPKNSVISPCLQKMPLMSQSPYKPPIVVLTPPGFPEVVKSIPEVVKSIPEVVKSIPEVIKATLPSPDSPPPLRTLPNIEYTPVKSPSSNCPVTPQTTGGSGGSDDSPMGSPSSASKCETDPRRLHQRQKQIDYGYRTLGYIRYRLLVVKDTRVKGQPKTPRKSQACSKRSWDGQVKKWRRELHKWDPSDASEFEVLFSPEVLASVFDGTGDMTLIIKQLQEQVEELKCSGNLNNKQLEYTPPPPDLDAQDGENAMATADGNADAEDDDPDHDPIDGADGTPHSPSRALISGFGHNDSFEKSSAVRMLVF